MIACRHALCNSGDDGCPVTIKPNALAVANRSSPLLCAGTKFVSNNWYLLCNLNWMSFWNQRRKKYVKNSLWRINLKCLADAVVLQISFTVTSIGSGASCTAIENWFSSVRSKLPSNLFRKPFNKTITGYSMQAKWTYRFVSAMNAIRAAECHSIAVKMIISTLTIRIACCQTLRAWWISYRFSLMCQIFVSPANIVWFRQYAVRFDRIVFFSLPLRSMRQVLAFSLPVYT